MTPSPGEEGALLAAIRERLSRLGRVLGHLDQALENARNVDAMLLASLLVQLDQHHRGMLSLCVDLEELIGLRACPALSDPSILVTSRAHSPSA